MAKMAKVYDLGAIRKLRKALRPPLLEVAFFAGPPFQLQLGSRTFLSGAKSQFFGCHFNSRGQVVIIDLYSPQRRLLQSTFYPQLSENVGRDLRAIKRKGVPYSVVVSDGDSRVTHHYQADGNYTGKERTKGDRIISTVEGRTTETISVISTDGTELCLLGINNQRQVVEVRDQRSDNLFSSTPQMPGVVYGRRVSVNSFEEGLALSATIRTPVELALPHDISAYRAISNRLSDLAEALMKNSLNIQTVHATQAPITEDPFLTWGEETLAFADRVKAKVVTVHPNKVARDEKDEAQKRTVGYINKLLRQHQAVLAIETFRSGRRVFSWHDLLESDLPMVLDTAHLSFDQSRQLIRGAGERIKAVHLSAVGPYGQHLPVDMTCINILRLLRNTGSPFPQAVILEYLPEFEVLYNPDLARLSQS